MAVVTFTTDFGRADAYAGAMKGVVLSLAPNAVLIDITHDVPPRDVAGGAFTLAHAAPWFPPGTIHVAVVDPGVGTARTPLLVEAGGAYFVGPDNGLLALAARPPRRAWAIESPAFRREPVSPTFHGRDLFAPAAGRLAAGWSADQAGTAVSDLVPAPLPTSAALADSAVGEVIHIDAFGNLVTSFVGTDVAGTWLLEVGEARFSLAGGRTFGDVAAGAPVLYAGSSGQVEIAVRDGSAAALTGAARGARVRLGRVRR